MKQRALLAILLGATLIVVPASAAAGSRAAGGSTEPVGLAPTGADMPTVGGNLGNQHYSGLTQINKRNLDRLGPVWRTHVSAVPPATDATGQQTTPIVADGVIYLDTPNGEVIAVDGRNGAPKWKWAPEGFDTADTRRGVSLGDGKVYTLADGDRIVALDQDTGEEVWVVQPAVEAGVDLGQIDRVATVYSDGVVYAHAANGDRAAVVAVDSDDGSYIWHFFGGPDRGTVFTDVNGDSVDAGATWGPVLPDGTECNLEGGATPWMHGAVDPELGMYYMTFGNARSCTSSQDGSLRPGDNLFSSTMVAVDHKTGEYKWHYQSIRHDVWTWTTSTRPRWPTSTSAARYARWCSTAASPGTSSCWTGPTVSPCSRSSNSR
jgi:quinohemoprotein ethanol dehydrogenase